MKVGILFGGRSVEHEVSIMSAKNVSTAIDRSKHQVVHIGIDKGGLWHLSNNQFEWGASKPFLEMAHLLKDLDVVFPVLHGPFGEDGSIQGMLETAGIPYVGASILGSAIALDKDVTKRLLRDAGIVTANFLTFTERPSFDAAAEVLGLPLFIKPATMGSSIGLTKAYTKTQFEEGLDLAFSLDPKILIEEAIVGREIECSVLGLEELKVSLPGEIVPQGNMQTYEGKYFESGGAQYILPVALPREQIEEMQVLAKKVFRILCCDSMARVDFFLSEGQFILNEINTIPGFTNLSVYPRLWEASGLSQTALIEELLQLALQKSEASYLLDRAAREK